MVINHIEDCDKFTVYQITNSINGKRYIGVHKTKNIDDPYMGSGKLIKAAIKKYGIENFNKETILIFDNNEDMLQAEVQLILDLKPEYNLHEGGYGGWDYVNANFFPYLIANKIAAKSAKRINAVKTSKTKILKSKINEYNSSPNYCLNCNAIFSYSMKNNKYCDKLCYNPHRNAGRKHSKETKEKIGNSNRLYNDKFCLCGKKINFYSSSCIKCVDHKYKRLLSKSDVKEIIKQRKKLNIDEISKKYNVKSRTIYTVLSGKYKTKD